MTKRSEEIADFVMTYGGWYQRTTLHLVEIYEFCANGTSKLALDKKKLTQLQRSLRLKSVTRRPGTMEFLDMETEHGIAIRYFEDGLYVFEMPSTARRFEKDRVFLEKYAQEVFTPAIGYIFSLGAPTPKILANIPVKHPIVLRYTTPHPQKLPFSKKLIGTVYSELSVENVTVHKTDECIVVASKPGTPHVSELVESHIFFREFKSQLEKYLSIHRTIWEKISDIKERKQIRVKDLTTIRGTLDAYQKTVTLIGSRMQQMASYSKTRAALAQKLDIDTSLRELFAFKFETLNDTLEYVKELWKMTIAYLQSAITNVTDIQGQGTQRGIQALQVLTTVGALNVLIQLFIRKDTLAPTLYGSLYVFGILLLSWGVMVGVKMVFQRKTYSLTFSDKNRDL